VNVDEYETLDKLRIQSSETRVDDDGEVVPVYEFINPAEGVAFVRLVLSLGTEVEREMKLSDNEIFHGDEVYLPKWTLAEVEHWIETTDEPFVLHSKSQIEVVYAVPVTEWSEMELRIAGDVYPLTVERIETPEQTG
jgi:hypothetical protein